MTNHIERIEALENSLGYRFVDRIRIVQALTHSSVTQSTKLKGNNQRLEFLGDRVLGLMASDWLFEHYPYADEGEMSRRFHSMVCNEACVHVASKIDLGAALRLANGEAKLGGRLNPTIIGDAMEAVIAAIYLEKGYSETRDHFKPFWLDLLLQEDRVFVMNPKSFIQEWAAREKKPAPQYKMISRQGPDHAPSFLIELVIDGKDPIRAVAGSLQAAEKNAAKLFIDRENLT